MGCCGAAKMAVSSPLTQLTTPLPFYHYQSHLHLHLRPKAFPSAAASSHPDHNHDPPDLTIRKHNSKSTALLLQRLSHFPNPNLNSHHPPPPPPPDDKSKLLERSLLRKRTPQFPGSISLDSSSLDSFRDDDDEHRMIMRALEIRRKVTAEIFKEVMMTKGKFGITYATNLTETLTDFLDYVMIEAAAMKRSPEFSDSTFNFRAKIVIEDSEVVPCIRYYQKLYSFPLKVSISMSY